MPSKPSRIHVFNLQRVLSPANNAQVAPEAVSAGTYWAWHQNSFLVFPDESTVAGARYGDRKTLQIEDIGSEESPVQVGKQPGSIGTVSANEDFTAVIAGDSTGHVFQYKASEGAWYVFKKYGNLGIGDITSSAQLDDLVVVGRYKHFRFVDVSRLKVLEPKPITKLNYLLSLQVYFASDSKLYLDLVGNMNSAYDYKFDVYDVTGVFEQNYLESKQGKSK